MRERIAVTIVDLLIAIYANGHIHKIDKGRHNLQSAGEDLLSVLA